MNEGNDEEDDELVNFSTPAPPQFPEPSTSQTEHSPSQPGPGQSTANIGFSPYPSNKNVLASDNALLNYIVIT